MSFLGIGLPAAVGIASDIVGGLFGADSAEEAAEMQFQHQWDLMNHQNDINVANYRHRHQWEVSDLRKAGLNPILSANSAAGVPSVGLGSASLPDSQKYDISKAMNNVANTALAKKQLDLEEYRAQSDRIKADADMLRAKNDEARTPSAISMQESQSQVNLKNIEMLDKNYELNKIYNEAQVREIDQRIINSVMEVEAKVEYLHKSGEAAMISASAQGLHAEAAMRSAAAQEIIAQVAEANGISQRQLNDALEGKASAETKEAMERTLKVAEESKSVEWNRKLSQTHNPAASEGNSMFGNILMRAGEYLRNGFSGASGFVP